MEVGRLLPGKTSKCRARVVTYPTWTDIDGANWYCTVRLPPSEYGVRYLNWMPRSPRPSAFTSNGSSGVHVNPVSIVGPPVRVAVGHPATLLIGSPRSGLSKAKWNWNGSCWPKFGAQ